MVVISLWAAGSCLKAWTQAAGWRGWWGVKRKKSKNKRSTQRFSPWVTANLLLAWEPIEAREDSAASRQTDTQDVFTGVPCGKITRRACGLKNSYLKSRAETAALLFAPLFVSSSNKPPPPLQPLPQPKHKLPHYFLPLGCRLVCHIPTDWEGFLIWRPQRHAVQLMWAFQHLNPKLLNSNLVVNCSGLTFGCPAVFLIQHNRNILISPTTLKAAGGIGPERSSP